jgi:hypothetical protein
MKYILMMNGTRSNFESYAKWSKQDIEANVAFMRNFSKELKDTAVFVDTKGLAWPQEAKRSGRLLPVRADLVARTVPLRFPPMGLPTRSRKLR